MAQIKWVKRDPDAALVGMAQLTLEQRGAYQTIQDLIYSRDGDLPDDEHLLCTHLRCRPQTWRRLRGDLIAAGKLRVNQTETGSKLVANRTETELKLARKRILNASNAAKKRWGNNGPDDADASFSAMTTTTTTTTTPTKKKEDSTATDVAETPKRTPAKADRGTRLPENWHPSEACMCNCEVLLGQKGADDALAEFRDYWTALPDGRQARKINWDKTFTNRCRALKGRNGHGKSRAPTPRERTVDALQRLGSGSVSEVFDLGLPKLRHQ